MLLDHSVCPRVFIMCMHIALTSKRWHVLDWQKVACVVVLCCPEKQSKCDKLQRAKAWRTSKFDLICNCNLPLGIAILNRKNKFSWCWMTANVTLLLGSRMERVSHAVCYHWWCVLAHVGMHQMIITSLFQVDVTCELSLAEVGYSEAEFEVTRVNPRSTLDPIPAEVKFRYLLTYLMYLDNQCW